MLRKLLLTFKDRQPSWIRLATVSAGAIGVCLLVPGLGTAQASEITYTETATISGSLNGHSFSGEMITLTGTGNTADIFFNTPKNTWENDAITVTFSIAGVGSGTFTDQTDVASDQAEADAGFGDLGVLPFGGILFTTSGLVIGYNLSTPIGPISSNTINNISPTSFFPTTDGLLNITAATNETFTATAAPATPLPAALPLFATGLGALGLLGWRRKRKARTSLLGVV